MRSPKLPSWLKPAFLILILFFPDKWWNSNQFPLTNLTTLGEVNLPFSNRSRKKKSMYHPHLFGRNVNPWIQNIGLVVSRWHELKEEAGQTPKRRAESVTTIRNTRQAKSIYSHCSVYSVSVLQLSKNIARKEIFLKSLPLSELYWGIVIIAFLNKFINHVYLISWTYCLPLIKLEWCIHF